MHRRAMVGAALIVCVLNPSGRLLAAEEQVRRDSTISPGRDEFLGRFLDYYVGWAGKIEERGQSTGTPLDPEQTRLALEIGIKHPERVRLVFVDEVPFPTDNPEIKLAGEKFGFIGPGITNNAQAFGYSVWIRNGFSLDRPRLAHELARFAAQARAEVDAKAAQAAAAQAYREQVRGRIREAKAGRLTGLPLSPPARTIRFP